MKVVFALGVTVVVLQVLAYWALSAGLKGWDLRRTSVGQGVAANTLMFAGAGLAVTIVGCLVSPALLLVRWRWEDSD